MNVAKAEGMGRNNTVERQASNDAVSRVDSLAHPYKYRSVSSDFPTDKDRYMSLPPDPLPGEGGSFGSLCSQANDCPSLGRPGGGTHAA
jgi:hypothetical protein